LSFPNDKIRFRHGLFVAIAIVLTLIAFAVINGFYNQDLHNLGIRPRTVKGIVGIFTAPLLHGDFNHLLSNSFPLLFAIPGLFYFHYKDALSVLIVVYLLSGFWVWLTGRDAVHLGASGVVFGLLSFLFFAGLFQKNRSGFAVAAIILFLYGIPVITGFIPSPGISFEAHISGATAGLFMATYISLDRWLKRKKTVNENNQVNSTAYEEITFIYQYHPKDESEDNASG
jgi:membrane associated rhomboid family serine protease